MPHKILYLKRFSKFNFSIQTSWNMNETWDGEGIGFTLLEIMYIRDKYDAEFKNFFYITILNFSFDWRW